jgi:signal transduction histidine kinase
VLKDADGLAVKLVGFSRDISTQREAELERERLLASERRARDEAERQSHIKDEFLATLSHELRTPMNTILGWLNILNNGQAPDPAMALQVIERNAKAQAQLIEDLLQMNLLSLGTARLELSSVDVRAAIESAAQNLQPAASAKRITIDVSVEEGLPAMTADSGRVQQILWNLLHNAVKFTTHDGRVDVRARLLDGGIVRIVVSDNGSGIPPEFLPHVFERFRQADSSPTRKTFGLGLGLSIAKHLVELHGGSIEAASDGLGCGAQFTVDLPLRLGTRKAAAPETKVSLESSMRLLPPVNLESRSTH